MIITDSDVLTVENGCLRINGRPAVVDFPTGKLDSVNKSGRLVAFWSNDPTSTNREFYPEEIEAYWA